MKNTKKDLKANNSDTECENDSKKYCGIIMPISQIDGCSAEHWLEVKNIYHDVIESSSFKPRLVSQADESGVIQSRIIQNLYNDPIVICDVSGKNPNVMFELGIRLAFDKPTIVIKDDQTDYSFDTGVIEHITYPRDLRFSRIVSFKKILSEKIMATYKASTDAESYTTFLKHFGEFRISKLEDKEVSGEEYILTYLKEIKNDINKLKNNRYDLNYINKLKNNRYYLNDDKLEILRPYIDKFKVKNDINSNTNIFTTDIKESLINYLSNNHIIRDEFKDVYELTEFLENNIF